MLVGYWNIPTISERENVYHVNFFRRSLQGFCMSASIGCQSLFPIFQLFVILDFVDSECPVGIRFGIQLCRILSSRSVRIFAPEDISKVSLDISAAVLNFSERYIRCYTHSSFAAKFKFLYYLLKKQLSYSFDKWKVYHNNYSWNLIFFQTYAHAHLRKLYDRFRYSIIFNIYDVKPVVSHIHFAYNYSNWSRVPRFPCHCKTVSWGFPWCWRAIARNRLRKVVLHRKRAPLPPLNENCPPNSN